MKNGIHNNIYDELVQSIDVSLKSIQVDKDIIPLSPQPTPFPGYPIKIDNRGGMIGSSNNTINNGLSSWAVVLMVITLILAILILGQ